MENGDSRIWAICGADGTDKSELALLSTSAFKTGAYGYNSKYSGSDLVTHMDQYLGATYFSDKELEKMADVTVYTDEPGTSDPVPVENRKLYVPNSENQNSYGSRVTTIYAGSGNNIAIDLKKLTNVNGFQQTRFWLRSPFISSVGVPVDTTLVAVPDGNVKDEPCRVNYVAWVPAFNLNLSSVLFASAANTASLGGQLTVTENTYTLRCASTTGESGKISKSGKSVQVKDAKDKFLVAQNNSGAYAKKITKDDETITASQMGTGITNFNDCEVWIESTDAGRITTATRIVDKVSVRAPLLTVNPITKTYDGNPVADSEITGTAKIDGADISGRWKFVAGQELKAVNDSGTKNVIFTPDAIDMYGEAQGTLQFIMAVAGVLLNVWIRKDITPQILLAGMYSGLASTGLHQAFVNLLERGGDKEGTR